MFMFATDTIYMNFFILSKYQLLVEFKFINNRKKAKLEQFQTISMLLIFIFKKLNIFSIN